MSTQEFGELLFESKKSLKLPILWTLIFILPVSLLLGSFIKNGNVHILLFALLLISPALFMFITRPFAKLSVYDKGIMIQSVFGCKSVPLTLNSKIYIQQQVDNLSGINVARHTKIKIVTGDQRLTIPSSFKEQEDVVTALNHFQQNHLLPSAVDRLHHNQTLNFDTVKLNNSKIAIKNKTYLWSDIKELTVDNGVLRLYTKDGSLLGGANAHMDIKSLPNCHTLFKTMQQLRHA